MRRKDSDYLEVIIPVAFVAGLWILSSILDRFDPPFQSKAEEVVKEELAEMIPSFEPELPPKKVEEPPPPPTRNDLNLWPLPKRIYVGHVGGNGRQAGISFGTDYATLQVLLAPHYRQESFMYMIDLRGHRFDNNTFAANGGLGLRYIPPPNTFCELLGVNGYFDWRQGFVGDYYQTGVGVEALGSWWDFRANGYIPLGRAKNTNVCNFSYPGGYFITGSDCEFATYGFNAEVGCLAVDVKDFLLYIATGPYYLTNSSCHFESMGGFEFRIRPQYKDYVAIEGRVSWDSVYKWVYQTELIFSIPLYQIAPRDELKKSCRITDRQIYQPVERFEVMPLGRKQCWRSNF